MGFAIDETVFYLAAGAVLLPVLLLVASLGLGPFARRRGKKWYCRALLSVTYLLWLALVLGIPANLIFVAAVRYRYYIPGDPVVDWLPFIPSGAWVIDPEFGGRFVNGGSPQMLQIVWAILAVPVWAASWYLHSRTFARLRSIADRV